MINDSSYISEYELNRGHDQGTAFDLLHALGYLSNLKSLLFKHINGFVNTDEENTLHWDQFISGMLSEQSSGASSEIKLCLFVNKVSVKVENAILSSKSDCFLNKRAKQLFFLARGIGSSTKYIALRILNKTGRAVVLSSKRERFSTNRPVAEAKRQGSRGKGVALWISSNKHVDKEEPYTHAKGGNNGWKMVC